jgi:RsiW-degrading membrane proteinase PrsW (M82 family)
MFSDIFSILAFILLIATTGLAYSFSSTKNKSLPVKVISAIIGFSLAATLLCFRIYFKFQGKHITCRNNLTASFKK